MKENTKTALKSLLILGAVGGGIYLIVLRTRHQKAFASGALHEADLEACGLDRECRQRVQWEWDHPGESYEEWLVGRPVRDAVAKQAKEDALRARYSWLFAKGA